MLVDSHAHLTSDDLFGGIHGILERAKQAGIERIVNICTNEVTLERGLVLTAKYPWVANTAATTPHDVDEEGELFFPLVENAALNRQLAAIGETGLDYHYIHSAKETQQKFLSRYFHLAAQFELSVVIHCREAFDDLFAIADQDFVNGPAVLHCFTGSMDEAKGVLDRGWFLSCSGIATFKKSHALQEVIRYAPLDRLLIETDAPYLAPQSRRGKTNEPAFIVETAEMIAQLKGISVQEVAEQTSQNAIKLFHF